MADEANERWTCGACGCNTNPFGTTNCSICGTSNQVSSALRRGGPSRAWWPRGLARRGGDDGDLVAEELWESLVESNGIPEGLESFSIDVSELANRARLRSGNRERFLEAAQGLLQPADDSEDDPRPEPDQVRQVAMENAASFQPHWATVAQLLPRSRRDNGIQVGEGEHRNLAHLPVGAAEGRAIRAESPIPRSMPQGRGTFGFKVAFHHPTFEHGASPGGFLVGLVTGSFTNYADYNGLAQSQHFYGIEDIRKRYEGPRFLQPGRVRRGGPSYGSEVSPEDAPMNEQGLLFGAEEVITVVCDLDNHNMLFWRDDTFLGTFVTSLPRSGMFYPVAVPFNIGVTVAITGLNGDPLSQLGAFASDWHERQREKHEAIYRQLEDERARFIRRGKPTKELNAVLKEIFNMYLPDDVKRGELDRTVASRLWWRCRMKLSHLEATLQDKHSISFQTFQKVIKKLIAEDESICASRSPPKYGLKQTFKVGDTVELAEGYEKFGDAVGGPLSPHDRGVVIELQLGPNGDCRSVRVLCNGRRWWYQPHAVVNECSGLVASSGVWFLKRLLRSHGFDCVSMDSISGKPVTSTSWQVGDVVLPKKGQGENFGVITTEPASPPSLTSPTRSTSTSVNSVWVNYGSEVKRVRINKLLHASWLDVNAFVVQREELEEMDIDSLDENSKESSPSSDENKMHLTQITRELRGMEQFEKSSLDSIVRQSKTGFDALVKLCDAGLPDVLASALDNIETQVRTLEPRDDTPDNINAIGLIIKCMVEYIILGRSSKNGLHDEHALATADVRDPNRTDRPSAQERRGFLLSVMSRARRNGPGVGIEESFDFLSGLSSGSMEMYSGAQHFASGLEELVFENDSPVDYDDDVSSDGEETDGVAPEDSSFLNELLYGHGDQNIIRANSASAALSGDNVMCLIDHGFMNGSLEWIKACMSSITKEMPSSQSSGTRLLTDAEGTPLLELAVMLGSPQPIIRHLIAEGVAVGEKALNAAALSDQPDALATLLEHSSCLDCSVDYDIASDRVKKIIETARKKRVAMQEKMRETAISFATAACHKIMQIALNCRHHNAQKTTFHRKLLLDLLVGDTLIQALRDKLKSSLDQAQELAITEQVPNDRTIRFDISQDSGVGDLNGKGVLGSLPEKIVHDIIFESKDTSLRYFLLVEDLLYRKDMPNISSGLQLLQFGLRSHGAFLRSEHCRFGFRELARMHRDRASHVINEAGNKHSSDNDDSSESGLVVKCPRNHTAVIHVTRHSSFRCDLCGTGVEMGRPMHGCRQCDWDACEDCTDKAESGIIKWKAVRSLAGECLHMLDVSKSNTVTGADIPPWMSSMRPDQTVDLKRIAEGLLDHDLQPVKQIRDLLKRPGGITMHEIESSLLSAIHGALTSSQSKVDGRVHQKKKAKTVAVRGRDDVPDGDFIADDRIQFCRLFAEIIAGVAFQEKLSRTIDRTVDMFTVSLGGSEFIRRVQRILAFHENASTTPHLPWCMDAHSLEQNEICSLKRALELCVMRSDPDDSAPRTSFTVSAEPLASIADLESHLIEQRPLNLKAYTDYCVKLADDEAIVVERHKSASLTSWKLAKVMGYHRKTGVHTVCYATSTKPHLKDGTLRLGPDGEGLDDVTFSSSCETLVLATRVYFVLYRRVGTDMDIIMPHTQKAGYAEEEGDVAQEDVDSESEFQLMESANEDHEALRRVFPFLSDRQRDTISRNHGQFARQPRSKPALQRSWSALSLADAKRPIDLSLPIEAVLRVVPDKNAYWKCLLDDCSLSICGYVVEYPPEVSMSFSIDESSGLRASGSQIKGGTLVGLLGALTHGTEKKPANPMSPIKLFATVSINMEGALKPSSDSFSLKPASSPISPHQSPMMISKTPKRRKFSSFSINSDTSLEDLHISEFSGFGDKCIQCMEIISSLAEGVEDHSVPRDVSSRDALANKYISKKLVDLLNSPVAVVSGALPDWTRDVPSFAPRVFTYESRRTLLERTAFGISRSTWQQQEVKINVGRLRQRMASLRSRAVELVAEAFSGGAEDPTALQLQADELYGMEEALAARVRACFRAAKWQEHSLEVAKAAVRRKRLIHDTMSLMEQFANDPSVCKRRLEVRFHGESGFDAAAGDEAGVTRGFYADVAEALLSTENVAGVYYGNVCHLALTSDAPGKTTGMDIDSSALPDASKPPLWIPDMDATSQVVIPTPRARPTSGLGVYPRPLSSHHPQLPEVLRRFRLMGRLFAAALRDGFMFPLPLSCAFLKLVQQCSYDNSYPSAEMALSSGDLPRPGFLGGEVYAVATHICEALDAVDANKLDLHESKLRYEQIAKDKNFARKAMGKSYDCSFEDYFDGRTFVDPLDPSQGEDAAPLCPFGHRKSVDIFNVRQWVALAKRFILHDGVVEQARAFRRGVDDFFNAEYLSLFTAEELQRDICGSGDNVDLWDEAGVRKLFKLDGGKGATEALVAVAAIGGEGGAALSRRFGPESTTIKFLVKCLLDASPKERRQFLSFVTSVPIVTPGRIEVVPIVSPSGDFLPMHDPGCLPRANTCARRLYLPRFENYESFAQVIRAVIREESKFKGFFEWRGS